jgi:4-diphosphocytidyl-2-C-methyl-D-erythritol kinase
MILFPNAKINLGLHVVRKRPDGYHDIETLFYPVPELCDILELVHADRFEMHCHNAEISGENLCEKAWRLMAERFGIPPVAIHLYKKIPMGAGLGGGSADAAFTLTGLNDLFGLQLPKVELAGLAAQLGSDCAFFVYNRPMLATGRGEVLTPVDFTLDRPLRIFPQPVFVSTREAYAGITPHAPEHRIESVLKLPVERWDGLLVNDFETTVFARHPELQVAKQALYDDGAAYAAMSGSGSALFAIY